MKKLAALLLALAMMLSIVACSSQQASSADPAPTEAPPVEEMTAEQAAALSVWADDLYEPETSITYSATIAWPADDTALAVADESVRPNTMIVKVDKDLAVYSMDGKAISGNLGVYLAEVKDTTLAALYISDADTAAAVSAFATEYELADVFVVASYEHPEYVTEICEANVGVLGMIDWTDASLTTERADLLKIIQGTNGAHAKVALVPEELCTYEAVEYMRGMLLTVWAETSPNAEAIYTQLTNGVNGIYCSDYAAVAEAISSFADDGVSLLRHVYITGHRGLPSEYIECTINSGRAAIEAGANVIECDIGLSADGELFVLHDDTVGRLFNDPDDRWAESLTLAELQALEFDMTDDTKENAPNSVLNANNENRNKAGRENMVINYDPETDRIPSLREYWEELDDEDVIHFIEIKSYQPAIVSVLKELAEEMDMTDRMCVITFNDGGQFWNEYDESKDVMKAMEAEWPEMSLGYLGMGMAYNGNNYYWGSLGAYAEENGVGAAVGYLYTNFLKQYNATLNDSYGCISLEVNAAARHRGLTSWEWTYNAEADFANHYLNGGTYSMTTNYTTWASDWAIAIEAEDAAVSAGDALNAQVISQIGDVLDVNGELELVVLEGAEVALEDGKIAYDAAGEALVMARYTSELDVNGVALEIDPTYTVYSNPFTLTLK
ncbi:MAG: hypothetical protein IJ484_00365 [Oscillospiraceae bacterium]|nr:hypothetical protein [Oscillospiraceae bacterium]